MTDPSLPPGMSPTSAPRPTGEASASAETSTAAVKRRQLLLLAAIAGTIVAGTLLSVALTGSKNNDAQPAKPQSTNILDPGAQVDPRDAWRGQADAQLKAIEQRSRDLAQRNAELEGQGKEMLERLKKLEGSGLTPLPPPPVTAPAARPSFGPDRPGSALPDAGPQRFPPPPPPLPQGAGLPPPPGGVQSMPTPTGIDSIVLGAVAAGKGAKPAADAAAAAPASRDTRVGKILRDGLKYSLQGLKKTREGTKQHPDRDAQFHYLSQQCLDFQQRGQPVISVDAKKKELIGDFKNGGREWQPQGKSERVRTHDFEDKELGKGIPYGIYDLGRNEGWVSVGVDHDTAEFAVSSIRNWWARMGKTAYPQAQELLITADAGGSNSYRTKLWKRELQKLADETGLTLTICHFPPGTSKWNKIEHRMFCHITTNWRGRPLSSLEVTVNLIAATTTLVQQTAAGFLQSGHRPRIT